jgi:hypothetical protein
MSLPPTHGTPPDPVSSSATARPRNSPLDEPRSPQPPMGSMLSARPPLSGVAADTKLDILLWSIVIPAMALVLFARSLFTALRQAPAAASQPPPAFLQLFHANLQTTHLLLGCFPRLLTILTLSAVCSAAAWLAPSWYLQHGREQLLAAARLLPKGITVLQLLLLPAPPPGTLQRVWLQTSIVGAKGLLGVLTWPLLFPVSALAILNSFEHCSGAVCSQAAPDVARHRAPCCWFKYSPVYLVLAAKQNKVLQYVACAANRSCIFTCKLCVDRCEALLCGSSVHSDDLP